MNKTLFILLLVLSSCGTRKVATDKAIKIEEDEQEITSHTTTSEKQQDLSESRELLQEFEVRGSDMPYRLKYAGLTFEGKGDIKFNKSKKIQNQKKESEKESNVSYLTHTTYKTVTKFKSKDVESKRPSFWLLVLVGVVSIVAWGVSKKYFYKIINR